MSKVARIAGLLLALAALIVVSSGPTSAQQQTTIPVGDLWFCDSSFQDGVCTTTINVGDTVVWDFNGATLQHTTTECGADCDNPTTSPLWNSGTISGGGTFEFTFDQEGTYLYLCQIHPFNMRGEIVVQGAAQAPTPTETPSAPQATPTTQLQPPATGSTSGGGSSGAWVLALGLAAAGLALSGLGFAAFRVRR